MVTAVLLATVREIAERGYVGFRFDEVAQAAGVNRTSIYRRWPTKAKLVEAALRSTGTEFMSPADSGDTSADLLTMLQRIVRWQRTPQGKGVRRMVQLDLDEPELARIIEVLRAEFMRPWLDTLDEAKRRGELDPSIDSQLLTQMMLAPAMARLEVGEPVTRRTLEVLVRVTLAGARAPVTVQKASKKTLRSTPTRSAAKVARRKGRPG